MITVNNYFSKLDIIKPKELPEKLYTFHKILVTMSERGNLWLNYKRDKEFKHLFDLYIKYLNEKIQYSNKYGIDSHSEKTVTQKRKVQEPKESFDFKIDTSTKSSSKSSTSKVNRISEELRFIKRFINLNGQVKTKNQIRLFLNLLQRNISDKRIGKSSPFAKEIMELQDELIKVWNAFGSFDRIKIKINEARLKDLSNLVVSQKVYKSIELIHKYISLQAKKGNIPKATKLLRDIDYSINHNVIQKQDPYALHLVDLRKNLMSFLNRKSKSSALPAISYQLRGILKKKNGLNGLGEIPDTQIVNSMDVLKLRFNRLGFKDKWLDFFGNPAKGFSVMVFGLPKFGKSILCIDFAGYLARNHGKVLYVAREEGIGDTLQDKLITTKVAHPNLETVGALPSDVSKYDFVFLDSVTKLGLTVDELEELRNENPNTSFIFIFQTTKQGIFRGNNSFQHDVDCVVEVPQKGKAIQYGRYNQGGELDIFPTKSNFQDYEI